MKLLKIEALNHQKLSNNQIKEELLIRIQYPKVPKKLNSKILKKPVLKRVMAQKVLECCQTFYSLVMITIKLKIRA